MVSLFAATLLSCGGAGAGLLDLRPGLARDEVRQRLERRDYCRVPAPRSNRDTHRPCPKPGGSQRRSWIITHYHGEVLDRLQRYERHNDPAQAPQRWNDLIAERSERYGPPSQMARERMLELRDVPSGAISWAAWYRTGYQVIVGLYLFRPNGPDDPDILEEIRSEPDHTESP